MRRLISACIFILLIGSMTGTVAQQRSNSGGRDAGAPREDVAADTATHEEIDLMPPTFGNITCLRVTPKGDVIAGDSEEHQLKLISAKGKLIKEIKLSFGPEAVNFAPNGTIYCGGQGKLAMLDPSGKVLKTIEIPSHAKSEITNRRKQPDKALRISGLAISDRDVFAAIGSGWSTGSKSKLFRFDHALENAKIISEGLRGCCQRCDIEYNNGTLYLAENAAHRVVSMDRDGKVLNQWGERDRVGIEGFGSCCNPMNIAFDSSGILYTAESGLGRVKKYSTNGHYLGLVGYIGVERFTHAGRLAASCSNMAIASSPDGEYVYVADIKEQKIRVLRRKG